MLVAGAFSNPSSVFAQISLTLSPYTQLFDSYAGTVGSIPSGWSVAFQLASVFNGVGTGTSSTGGAWAYGIGGENAFGALRSGTPGNITLGASFINNTGNTITSLTIGLTYEEWRYANTSGFNVSGTGALSSSSLSTLNYSGSAAGVNGVPTSTPALLTLTGLSISNGATFGINWLTTDAALADNGIALDNFALGFTALPEPGTWLTGAFAAAAVGVSLRKRIRRYKIA
jgi:hypothetical protein